MTEGLRGANRGIPLVGDPIAQVKATAGCTPGTGPHLREAACRLVVDIHC